MSRAVRQALEEAGRRPIPALDLSFAERLEARLLAVASTTPPPLEQPIGRSGSRSRLRGAIVVSGLAAAALALGLIVLVGRPGPSVELIAASNVEVALLDGTILEDPGGLLLPDDAVVTVGPNGSARIGDTLLVPGDVAVVRAGRLEVRHDPVAAVIGGAPATATPRPPASAPAIPAPTAPPQGAATSGPAAGSPVPTASNPTPTSRSEPLPPPTEAAPTPAPTPAVVRPRLKVRLLDGPRIAVTWTATWGAKSYVLVVSASRSGPAPDPTYPGSRILGRFAVPPDPRLRYRVPADVKEVRLMVVALRKDGSVLRRSRVVTITMPPSGDTAGSSPDAVATLSLAPTATPTATTTP